MTKLTKKEQEILLALDSGDDIPWGAATGAAVEALHGNGFVTKDGLVYRINQKGREFLMMESCWVPKCKLQTALAAAERPSKVLDFWCWWWMVAAPHSGSDRTVPPGPDYVRQSITSRIPAYSADVMVAFGTIPDNCEWSTRCVLLGQWRCYEMLISQPVNRLRHPAVFEGRHGILPIAVCLASLQLNRGPV